MTTSPRPDAAGKQGIESDEVSLFLDQTFDEGDLVSLRRSVAAHADRTKLGQSRVNDLVLIAYELATNAVRHGGGHGRLRLWLARGGVPFPVNHNRPRLPRPHRG